MVSVRLGKELEQRLEEMAAQQGRSKSAIIKEALQHYFERRQKERLLKKLKILSKNVSHVPKNVDPVALEQEIADDLF